MTTTTQDVSRLSEVYRNRVPFRGEMHDHAATGGTSDGKRPLSHWIGAMEALDMDFAAILDHRQVRHMYEPEWEDGLFLCGSEPGTGIIRDGKTDSMHYNLLTPTAAALEELLDEFPEYEFTGGQEGHFKYPRFTPERFGELIDSLKVKGGFFVHPHPTSLIRSENPLDYWFRDETAIEVFYINMDSRETHENYKVWTALLDCGKRVWAIAGGDGHACCSDEALTTIYAKERTNAAILASLRTGDFTCGPVGIRMCVGHTAMGGICSFAEAETGGRYTRHNPAPQSARLVLSVGDFHRSVCDTTHSYRADLIDDTGLVFSRPVTCTEPAFFAMNVNKNRKFYRAEVWDETRNLRIAVGNPIWNSDLMISE